MTTTITLKPETNTAALAHRISTALTILFGAETTTSHGATAIYIEVPVALLTSVSKTIQHLIEDFPPV